MILTKDMTVVEQGNYINSIKISKLQNKKRKRRNLAEENKFELELLNLIGADLWIELNYTNYKSESIPDKIQIHFKDESLLVSNKTG